MRAREKKSCVWGWLWYGVGMAKHAKAVSHQTPAEFAVAAKVHGTRRWRERAARQRERQERLRGVKMPAHRARMSRDEIWVKYGYWIGE